MSEDAFVEGFLHEIKTATEFDPHSAVAGAAGIVGAIQVLKRLFAAKAAGKAHRLVEAMGKRNISTKSLPFTMRNPTLGHLFAPDTLRRRVNEAEVAARKHKSDLRGTLLAARHLAD